MLNLIFTLHFVAREISRVRTNLSHCVTNANECVISVLLHLAVVGCCCAEPYFHTSFCCTHDHACVTFWFDIDFMGTCSMEGNLLGNHRAGQNRAGKGRARGRTGMAG